MPLHFRQNTPEIANILKIDTANLRDERIFQLQKLEEERVLALHHQEAQKQQQKAWHDRNIKTNNIAVGDLVLLYDSKVKGKPQKIRDSMDGSIYH